MKNENYKRIDDAISLQYSSHDRLSEYDRLVYPVVSRRAEGLSLGINVNPNKKCTFNCVYCQVDRSIEIDSLSPNLKQIDEELNEWLNNIYENCGLYKGHSLKDISIAGDGEPTTFSQLPELIENIIKTKKKYHFDQCKIVIFTNGTRIAHQNILGILPDLYANQGEIWFKLDYWDDKSLKQINRSKMSAEKLIENLILVGRQFPLVLQSCFFSWQDQVYQDDLYENYINLVKKLLKEGVQIKFIQAYTLARKPSEMAAKPWKDIELDKLCSHLNKELPVQIKKYYEKG